MGLTQDKGNEGEAIAKEFLETLGLKFIAANWRCKTGEIDLIFDDGNTRVFIEVRARNKTTFGEGDETVLWQKQKKLIRAAQYYQQKEKYWGDARFDVVSIVFDPPKNPQVSHIPDAFDTVSR